ncbi:malonyl-[acyl-carrier protein] O-methyltransferase [Brevibacillus reuszeri]|uniref:Malonyl-[acyl-carrier protein] O-methyltransferase n=1 Tax=Brevibacillus reuszeri TaxID=54915 RepID=A0A0K9YSX3_9BACL|nr:malonyl-ACP O-methyltransferase BioC [Brevibacillus reuszeri]KNB71824.1 malonyl-CoA O-methyltransferase [Brevibacillus reuszeri]MED1855344.1 malonyl-ACP O-methyltransferase BioC [Brevibacillus reuszeri]GED67507.1 malonyl-[acyl-carrier protein] O-methyltransferase [Brevibacillus reuszeri]
MGRTVVGSRFSAKAQSYEKYALVQKQMATGLFEMVKESACTTNVRHMLEIGCGTGGLTCLARKHFQEASYQAIDVASGMLQKAKERLAKLHLSCSFLQEDAEDWVWRQPAGSQDLILSGACFQWFTQPERTLRGLYRLLRLEGNLFFSTFGSATFCELHDSFAYAHASLGEPNVRHGLYLMDASEWSEMIGRAGFRDIRVSSQKVILTYPTVMDFLHAVKAVGANASHDQTGGLGSRKLMLEMMRSYERIYGSEQGVPVTYEIVYVHGKRSV